jgi:hypothetical protein
MKKILFPFFGDCTEADPSRISLARLLIGDADATLFASDTTKPKADRFTFPNAFTENRQSLFKEAL